MFDDTKNRDMQGNLPYTPDPNAAPLAQGTPLLRPMSADLLQRSAPMAPLRQPPAEAKALPMQENDEPSPASSFGVYPAPVAAEPAPAQPPTKAPYAPHLPQTATPIPVPDFTFVKEESLATPIPVPDFAFADEEGFAAPAGTQEEAYAPEPILDGFDDEDLGDAFSKMPVAREMPMPVPVSSSGAFGAQPGSGERSSEPDEDDKGNEPSALVIFFLTLTLLASLAVIYITGVANDVLYRVGIPTWEAISAPQAVVEESLPPN